MSKRIGIASVIILAVAACGVAIVNASQRDGQAGVAISAVAPPVEHHVDVAVAPEAGPHEGQVGICHFEDHEGDRVLGRQNPDLSHARCTNDGGNDIYVSERACEVGHRAAVSRNGRNTCTDHPNW